MADRGPAEHREALVVDAFVELADTLVDGYDVIDFCHRLLERALPLLHTQAGGIVLDHGGVLRVVASSSEDTGTLELFELQNSEGPCFDAFRSGELISVDRLDDQTERWPGFVPEAVARGWHSATAVPLRLRHRTIGALNLFSREQQTLSGRDTILARGLADVATIALIQERTISSSTEMVGHLQTALDSRVVLEQAKGRVAQHRTCGMQEAFDALRGHARSHSRRLTDVARDVIDGTLAIDDVSPGDGPAEGVHTPQG